MAESARNFFFIYEFMLAIFGQENKLSLSSFLSLILKRFKIGDNVNFSNLIMILSVHMIFGAALGAIVKNPIMAILAALISHYCLDFIPHRDYSIKNLEEKNWKKAISDILKIILDLATGLTVIFLLARDRPVIYVSALAALIPDGLTLLKYLYPIAIFSSHDDFHQKIQFLTTNLPQQQTDVLHGKISLSWRIAIQLALIIISIIALNL